MTNTDDRRAAADDLLDQIGLALFGYTFRVDTKARWEKLSPEHRRHYRNTAKVLLPFLDAAERRGMERAAGIADKHEVDRDDDGWDTKTAIAAAIRAEITNKGG